MSRLSSDSYLEVELGTDGPHDAAGFLPEFDIRVRRALRRIYILRMVDYMDMILHSKVYLIFFNMFFYSSSDIFLPSLAFENSYIVLLCICISCTDKVNTTSPEEEIQEIARVAAQLTVETVKIDSTIFQKQIICFELIFIYIQIIG